MTDKPIASHRGIITAGVMMASILQSLDNTIANVALPRIQGSMSATQEQMTWVLTSYIVAAAVMIPFTGWIAGQVGRKRVFLISIVGFTIASVLCGLSQSLPEIVGARLLQGMCGAALVPMSQAVLLDINPPSHHARAMAIWAMGVTIGPILGPVLGGWLTETYNWRWVFFINVPFGVLSCLVIAFFMGETPIRKSQFDFLGFATLAVAIGALQLMLDRGQTKDWFSSTEIRVTAFVGGLSLYLFVVHILTTDKNPFVSIALFKDRNFMTGTLFMFVLGIVLFATLALLPPLLQNLLNYPVILTGLVTAPRGLGTMASMFVVGRLVGKVDSRLIIAGGFALTAVSLWQMTHFYLQMDMSMIIWSGLAQGFGLGVVYVPLATLSFATLAPEHRNEGTALFSLLRNLGSSIGISTVQTLLTRNTQIMHSRLSEQITPFNRFLMSHLSGPAQQNLMMLNEQVTQQAEMIAYNNDFRLMLVMTLLSLPFIALLKGAGKERVDAPTVVE